MSRIALTNCILIDIETQQAREGGLRIVGETIAEAGPDVVPAPDDEVHDCGRAVVLPGLVNGHTHIYSALAVGMPPPADPPQNFREILERIWWRLDMALDEAGIAASAVTGALDALHCGTTTLIDHHASPNCILGSLDILQEGIERVGLRAVLCYEVTDRNGPDGCDAGLAENARFLESCIGRGDGRFAGLVGGHALFTLEDDTLKELRDLTNSFDVGLHLHLAEDPCDEEACSSEHQMFLIDRLRNNGLLQRHSLFAHGTHLGQQDLAAIAKVGCVIAHNTRSNMNNGVGYAPMQWMANAVPILLGTDGIGSDMFAEARAAYFKMRDEQTGLGPDGVLRMLANSARRASLSLGVKLGRLEPDHAADVVVTNYVPSTPIQEGNVANHFIFGMAARHVRHVMVAGQWRLLDGQAVGLDEPAERRVAVAVAKALWERM